MIRVLPARTGTYAYGIIIFIVKIHVIADLENCRMCLEQWRFRGNRNSNPGRLPIVLSKILHWSKSIFQSTWNKLLLNKLWDWCTYWEYSPPTWMIVFPTDIDRWPCLYCNNWPTLLHVPLNLDAIAMYSSSPTPPTVVYHLVHSCVKLPKRYNSSLKVTIEYAQMYLSTYGNVTSTRSIQDPFLNCSTALFSSHQQPTVIAVLR